MNVLLVGAGNSIHLQRWANGLVQAGCGVACATVHAPLPQGWDARVALHRLQPSGAVGYLLAVPALRRLVRRLIQQGRLDLVHAHYATGYGLLATLATLATLADRPPRLVSVWGSDVDEFPHHSPLHAWLLRRILLQADALAATSQALVRRVQQLLPAAPPLFVTPFGVDTHHFVPSAPAASDPQQFIIGTSKGLASTYGIDILLRAFAQLPACAPDGRRLQLRLLAGGPQRAEYEALCQNLGQQHRTAFVGGIPHSQMPLALQQMDIFVAPSRQESFGVSVLEASACERPVVASHVGGLPEVVQHGVTGLLVPPGDVQALASALAQLVQDAPLRQAMGAAGRRLVQQHYSWPTCVATMMAVYQQLAPSAAAAAVVPAADLSAVSSVAPSATHQQALPPRP